MTKILIHVGPPKTGSTSIQHFLSRNADDLERLGIFYAPRVEGAMYPHQHADTASHLRKKNWREIKKFSEQTIAPATKCSPAFIIISSESFASILDNEAWKKFLRYFPGFDSQIVFVKRDLRDLIKSSFYQQLEGNIGLLHKYETISDFVAASVDWLRRQTDFFSQRNATMLSYDHLSQNGKFCCSFIRETTGERIDLNEKKLNVTGPLFPKSRYFWTYSLRKMIAMSDGVPIDAVHTQNSANKILRSFEYDEGELSRLWQAIGRELDIALDEHA